MENPWYYQWFHFKDNRTYLADDLSLFKAWIFPYTMEYFKDKAVLDAGCGRGHHLKFLLPYIKGGMGVDLNTVPIAEEYVSDKKLSFLSADIESLNCRESFDVVYSIGVLHHTANPKKAFEVLKNCTKKGGTVIIMVYSYEGNFLVRNVLHFFNTFLFKKFKRDILLSFAVFLTLLLYLPVYTVYLLPLRSLPYYDFLKSIRKLSFKCNTLTVFDQINAPQTSYIKRDEIETWINGSEFEDINIRWHHGISWVASGRKK